MIKMILAVDRGNAIGWKDGRLPWKLPYDMKLFKAKTTGGTVVMGFNTFASLKRIDGLPNRKNIVLTRKNPLEARGMFGDNIDVISSLDWVQAHQERLGGTAGDLWIIGGASVYAEALEKKLVDELHVTLVDATSGADVTLPFDLVAWKLYILRERSRNVNWELQSMDRVDADGEIPGGTILVLKKV